MSDRLSWKHRAGVRESFPMPTARQVMTIGIIGTGNMGRALGTGWAQAGHDVFFGSRDPAKAKEAAGEFAESGGFDDAAAFGSIVLYTVRDVLPSNLLRQTETLTGKVVIDCTNSAILGLEVSYPQRPSRLHFEPPAPSPPHCPP